MTAGSWTLNANTDGDGLTTGRLAFLDLRNGRPSAERIIRERHPDAIIRRDLAYGGWSFTARTAAR